MAITKTNFINYSRCPRYVALDEVKKERLDADIDYLEYQEEEKQSKINELLNQMYDENETEEIDLIDVKNKQLETMMQYYNKVEELAGDLSIKYFGGKSIYSEKTADQKSFEFIEKGIKYLCYVDIYNENKNQKNIIEVKATTTNKFYKIGTSIKGEFFSIFEKKNNILYLKEDLGTVDMPNDKYYTQREKLFNRFAEGKYVYDLAVQRYIIEHHYIQNNETPNFKYYLGVLNHEYVFDGKYINNEAVYNPDELGNEIVTYVDLTNITKEYQERIEIDKNKIYESIMKMELNECPLGKYCEFKKPTQCKYFKQICGHKIPYANSSLNYLDNGAGFKVGDTRIKGLDLINEGILNLLDVPAEWITKENHLIQRDVVKNNFEYIDKTKIILGLNQLEYPIYHLDFETFPCPIPRFKGEKPYTQSPFEFSLHIENAPGVCDKDKDNYVFLATSFNDERKQLVKKLIEYIDPNKGTLFAQNVAFEKARIKEMADIFPEYKQDLMKIRARGFDLIWLLKTNKKIYEELGMGEIASRINYYHKDLSGSYSIKKTLPVFSDLSYGNLDVKNGTEAIIEYANYPKMDQVEFDFKYQALVEYCKQDTWAMVIILDKLRQLVETDV